MEKRSILESLTDCYFTYLKLGSKGYMIGFYNELNEPVKKKYKFSEGRYTLDSSSEDNFLLFKYETIENEKRNRKNSKRIN